MRLEAMAQGEKGRKIWLGGKAIPEICRGVKGEKMRIKTIGRKG